MVIHLFLPNRCKTCGLRLYVVILIGGVLSNLRNWKSRMQHGLHICWGHGGHWCISRLKIRMIWRVLVKTWNFNREFLSLKPIICKKLLLTIEFHREWKARGGGGGAYTTTVPPPLINLGLLKKSHNKKSKPRRREGGGGGGGVSIYHDRAPLHYWLMINEKIILISNEIDNENGMGGPPPPPLP